MKNCFRTCRAFTLVELLVAMSVLVLMMVCMFALTDATNRSTQTSVRAVDASTQARLALDRIGADLAGLLQRPDAVFLPGSTNGNLLQFVSQVQSANESTWSAGDTNRGVSVVAYKLGAATSNLNRPCLLRGVMPCRWQDVSFMGLGLPPTGYSSPPAVYPVAPSSTPGTADFDVLAPGVINLVIGYQLYPDNSAVVLAGANNTNPGAASGTTQARGQVVYTPPMRTDVSTAPYVDLTHVSAIVVGVAAIDLQNVQRLTAQQIANLAGAFSAPTAANTLPAQAWEPLSMNALSLPTSVPLYARQSVRVLQRFYPVTPFARR